jgi:hypothetical protein
VDKASIIFSVWSKRCRTGDEGAGLTTEAVHSRSVDHRREVAPHLVVGDPVGAKGLTRTGRAPFTNSRKRQIGERVTCSAEDWNRSSKGNRHCVALGVSAFESPGG